MPSVGHIAVGLAAKRLAAKREDASTIAWTALLVTLSLLPDADVVAFRLGIPYSAPFGHRGASHSLAFAGLVALVIWFASSAFPLPRRRIAITGGLVLATHGLLDTLTDGGLGIALLWPFSNERFFAPWRPLPVAPIGLRILSPHGLALMLYEAVLFLPVWVVAFWPRTKISSTGGHS
jgi:inner membrane protein